MKEDKPDQKLQELEKKKETLVVKYLELQDKADYYNEEIYKVCCEIETLNAEITVEKENRVRNNGSKVSNQEQKRRATRQA